MKKNLVPSLLLMYITFSAQKISDLKFETPIVEAENNYVLTSPKETNNKISYGYVYFDNFAGYSYRLLGNLTNENGILKLAPEEDWQKSSMMISRIGNYNLKVAKLDGEMLKKIGLPKEPKWLESYKSKEPENINIENRASILNGANYPNLALPMLEKLYKNGDRSKKLYFEIMFSYNALQKFSEAEKMGNEALKNSIEDDLIRKEYIFALAYQKKINLAEDFLNKNLAKFTNVDNRMEVLINMVAMCANENMLTTANKWFDILKQQPETGKYQKNINILDKIIKEKQSKIQ